MTTVAKKFAVSGMMCDHCVDHVTEALTAVPGVTDVMVVLDDATAKVAFDADVASFDDLAAAVTGAGYGLSDETGARAHTDTSGYNHTYAVSGMRCGNCAHHVKEALSGVAGVDDAYVSLDESVAYVKTDSAIFDDMAQAVADAGYELIKG